MGDLFDRNVHPLYSVIAFVSALIVLLLLTSGMRNRKGIRKNHKYIFLWVIFFCIQDGTWGLLAAHVIRSDAALFVASNVFHLSAVFSAFAWTIYFLSRLKIRSRNMKIYWAFAGLLVLVQLGMIAVNLSNRFMFYVDEHGWYQTTDYRAVMFYLQFATYILIGIVSLIGTAREQKKGMQGLTAIFFVNLAPLLFSVFQMIYPDAPADSIGFAIGCVIIELFLSKEYDEQVYTLEQMQEKLQENLAEITRQNEIIESYASELENNADQLSNYKRAVLSDALISLEVNLSRDELFYGAWKDDEGTEIPLKDLIGLDLPCSYDQYIAIWNRLFVKGTDAASFSDSTDREYLLETFNSGLADVTFDYEAKTISGRNAWLRRSISMIRNRDGDVIAFTSVKDISALVGQAKREESYIRALATEYSSIVIVGFEEDKKNDRVLLHSRTSEEITGLLNDDVLNEDNYSLKMDRFLRFVHPEDRKQFDENTRRENVLASFAEGRTHVTDFRILKPDGGFLYYQFRFVPLRDDSETPVGMIACMRNIDAEIRKEIKDRQDLEAAMIAAESANQAKTSFLFNMSHDIRTPMNAIIGFTDIAEKHNDEKDRVLDSLGKVKVSSNHLLSLVNDVLDMSRVESGTVRIEEEPVLMDALMDNLFSLMNGSAEEKNILFTACIDDSVTNHWIYADRLRMMRVLTNIVSNSIKYTNPGGKVHLQAEELLCDKEGCARYLYTITDTGIGMSPEFLSRVFEPFARAETATKSGVTGTGLGMSITKALVELMGGTISIESEQGRGTRVILAFENRIAEEVKPADVIPDDIDLKLEGKKILLVEDNEMNREIATEILEEEGLIIDTAEDGDIAVDKMKAAAPGRYDLILMDIQMPRMDGYEATRAIRALPDPYASSVPIVAMTANAFEEDRQNAFAAGMNGHLAKPIDISKLFATLSELLK